MQNINYFKGHFWIQFAIICILWLIPLSVISTYVLYTNYNAQLNIKRGKQDTSIAILSKFRVSFLIPFSIN